ncbi:hypothetical protein ABW19_dt0200531 [Dactylella cylindrospora]|nr:hypothetical protein ABW19_dt0200531 [Dactylella cylindrospora]
MTTNISGSPRTLLLEGLSAAIDNYVVANPLSQSHHSFASLHLPGGNTRSVLYTSPFPLTFTRGVGNKLYSLDKHEYIDFLGEYTAGLFGHSNERIKTAIKDAVEDGWSFGGVGEWEAKLARHVCERFGLDLCRFTNSGTEANLMALAVAKVITGRKKILVFSGAYHGSLLSFPSADTPSPLNSPHEYIIAPYNDTTYLSTILQDTSLTTTFAAILVEQMQGAGGCYPASTAFLSALRNLADAAGAVLIFDEVMTSRLSPGGLQTTHGIKPDMTTLGKYLGGGASFGCFGGKREIMELFDQGIKRSDGKTLSHPGTFNNNIFTMRAGCVACEILTPDVLEKLNSLGDKMRTELNRLGDKYGVSEKMWWTGIGSLMTVHFGERMKPVGEDKGYLREYVKTKDRDQEDLYWFWMVENGIYLARRGFVALTIEHMEEDVTKFIEATRGFLERWKSCLVYNPILVN